jgi:mannose-6-phosphate isomerase-like protein (cupin superfamily)
MHKVNLSQVPVEENPPSPCGRFRSSSQIFQSHSGTSRIPIQERIPIRSIWRFCRVPPGVSSSPYHAHSGQSELYLVLSGSGKFRSPVGLTELTSGDAVYCGPGEPHQIINDSEKDLVFYIIADNPVGESCYYLDSDKWGLPLNLDGPILKGVAVGYFDGEE